MSRWFSTFQSQFWSNGWYFFTRLNWHYGISAFVCWRFVRLLYIVFLHFHQLRSYNLSREKGIFFLWDKEEENNENRREKGGLIKEKSLFFFRFEWLWNCSFFTFLWCFLNWVWVKIDFSVVIWIGFG